MGEFTRVIECFQGPISIHGNNDLITTIILGETGQENGLISSPIDHFLKRFQEYLVGGRVEFDVKLDWRKGTPFQQLVWKACRNILHGRTSTYGVLARELNHPLASRAVGQALGKNPFPIVVPCHRVLSGSGKLGGFSGGLEWKKFLLQLEGVSIC